MATTKAPAQPDNQALVHRIIAVQSELKAPKGQYNSFGKYAYRNAEDILEAVKPLLAKNGLSMKALSLLLLLHRQVLIRLVRVWISHSLSVHLHRMHANMPSTGCF